MSLFFRIKLLLLVFASEKQKQLNVVNSHHTDGGYPPNILYLEGNCHHSGSFQGTEMTVAGWAGLLGFRRL